MSRQNVYDDERFFAGYRRMRAAEAGLNAAIEQPALRALLPDVRGKHVVDLGCGDGQLCFELARTGASRVVGIEPSERMLAVARERTHDERVRYYQQFAEDVVLPSSSVDVVVSSLALHYIADLDTLLENICHWLRPGGTLVASMEHPIVTATPDQQPASGWLVDDYADPGVRHTSWFIDDVIKYHRSISDIVNGILNSGLSLDQLDEPSPSPEGAHQRPDLAIHRRRPPLLLFRASRPASKHLARPPLS